MKTETVANEDFRDPSNGKPAGKEENNNLPPTIEHQKDIPEETGTVVAEKRNYETALGSPVGASTPSINDNEEPEPQAKFPKEDIPADKISKEGVPATKIPKEDSPTANISKEDIPATKITKEDIPATKISEEDIPATKISEEDVPAKKIPKEDVSAKKIPKEDVPAAVEGNKEATGEDRELMVLCGCCRNKPFSVPLFGCKEGHYVCNKCKKAGGILLSCPKCFDPELNVQLTELEEKLFQQDCCYKDQGCKQKLSEAFRVEHESECPYRQLVCPNRLFSRSCKFAGTLEQVREHGREVHSLNQMFTRLDRGFITCKMLHSKDGLSHQTLYLESARYSPLEIEFDEKLFYCYYERSSQGLWYFFIRIYGSEKSAKEYECEISLASGEAEKNDVLIADRHARVECLEYDLNRNQIHHSGNCLTVDDHAIRKMNKGETIFRAWYKISKKQ